MSTESLSITVGDETLEIVEADRIYKMNGVIYRPFLAREWLLSHGYSPSGHKLTTPPAQNPGGYM
jgi:hypothetical protein